MLTIRTIRNPARSHGRRRTTSFLIAALMGGLMTRLAASDSTAPAKSAGGDIDVARVISVAARKLAAYDASCTNTRMYPLSTKGSQWQTAPARDWVSGFYPGCLWQVYDYATRKNWSDRDAWRQRAEKWTAGVESQKNNTGTHDLGFMIFDSFGNGYRLTTNESYKAVVNQAAQSLASRFRTETGLIRSWGRRDDTNTFTVIVDNTMNLELLVWSAQHGGIPKEQSDALLRIARTHADHVMEYFFRPDGGTYHVIDLNPLTGAILKKRTVQGKADESTWSRGQTWAIYGFAYLFEATGERKYLDQSLKAADYYLSRLPADHVPPSDFQSDLKGLEFKDSSAGAIAASAFFRIARLVEDPALKAKYRAAAVDTLRALTSPPYFSEGSDKASLLVYAAYHYKDDAASPLTNTSLIWGDYYLLEALLQYEAMISSGNRKE
jgi:unsaturated chondroitin disaccharide hydrolase